MYVILRRVGRAHHVITPPSNMYHAKLSATGRPTGGCRPFPATTHGAAMGYSDAAPPGLAGGNLPTWIY